SAVPMGSENSMNNNNNKTDNYKKSYTSRAPKTRSRPSSFDQNIMKTSTLLGATLLGATLLGFAIASTQGQSQSSTTTSYVQTSKIVGMKVKDSSGQEVGVVKDVVLDRNTGCMAYTVLSTGGTGTRVTGCAKTVAVPWTVYTTTSDPSVMTVRVERDRVYNAPAFDYARIDE